MLYLYLRAFLCGSYDDFAELLFRLKALGKRYGVSELRTRRRRLGPELTSRNDHALCPDRIDDLGYRNAHLGQAIRLDPDAHRIVARAEHVHAPDPLDSSEDVLDVDQGVVAQEVLIVSSVFGREGDDHQEVRKRFLGGHPESLHFLGQLGRSGRDPVLREHGVHVRVGSDLEGGLDDRCAVVRVRGLHVDHVLHTVDLLLQRCGDRLFDTDGICPRVGRAYFDHGGCDVRILLDRKAAQEHGPDDDHEDGDDHGHDGPSYEEVVHFGVMRSLRSLVGLL